MPVSVCSNFGSRSRLASTRWKASAKIKAAWLANKAQLAKAVTFK